MNQIPDFTDIQERISRLQSRDPVGSLVFCAYNEEDYLLRTLDSISRLETSIPIEIIGINNASTDSTREILSKCSVKVFDEERRGTSYARQKGLEMAKGSIIFQTDSDTILPKTWIDSHYMHYSDPRTVCVGGGISFDQVHMLYHVYRCGAISLYRFLELFGRVNLNGGANLSYRRDAALAIGGFPEGANNGEDRLLQLNLMTQGLVRQVRGETIDVITSGRRMNDSKRIKKFIKTRLSTLLKVAMNRGEDLLDEDFENIR